jgi:hypothetical protein
MAGKVYRSVGEYVAAVEAAIPAAAENTIAVWVKEILRQYIARDVYGTYTPKPGGWVGGETYRRRHELVNSVEAWMEGNTLVATSTGEPSYSILGGTVYGGDEGEFLVLLASGNMGISGCQFPRPVIPQAQAAINSNIGLLTDLLISGLNEIV